MFTNTFYKKLFLLCGAWNLGAGIIATVFYKFVFEKAFLHPITEQDGLMVTFYMILFFTVGVIGLALLMAARDPAQNRALVFACAIGKIVPPIVWAWLYFTGHASWLLFSGIIVDFSFSFFFIMYLIRTK